MEQVPNFAEVITVEEPARTSRRAVCPLCRGDAKDYYRSGPGRVYPKGLRRDLLGANNSAQCPVSKVALDLALESARIHAAFPR
jgi:hypothetical protein